MGIVCGSHTAGDSGAPTLHGHRSMTPVFLLGICARKILPSIGPPPGTDRVEVGGPRYLQGLRIHCSRRLDCNAAQRISNPALFQSLARASHRGANELYRDRGLQLVCRGVKTPLERVRFNRSQTLALQRTGTSHRLVAKSLLTASSMPNTGQAGDWSPLHRLIVSASIFSSRANR